MDDNIFKESIKFFYGYMEKYKRTLGVAGNCMHASKKREAIKRQEVAWEKHHSLETGARAEQPDPVHFYDSSSLASRLFVFSLTINPPTIGARFFHKY